MRRGDRASAKIIRRRSAAERQFHVRVRIDAAGNDESAFGIDSHVSFHLELGADDGDDFVFDQDVGVVVVGGSDDVTIFD